jgi:nucleotide-binding universal stress UspA family protein
MNATIVLLALVALMLVVAGAVALAAGSRWRRPWRVTCPAAGTIAQIQASPTGAAVAELFGRQVELERCSLWPGRRGCGQDCLALPVTAQQGMRRGEAPPRDDKGADAERILVALDGTPGSEAVLAALAPLARASHATVRLLAVVKPVDEVRDVHERVAVFVDQESARVESEARDYLQAAARALPGVTVEYAVRVGDVPGAIVAEAEEAGASLIALASHRHGGITRLVNGSVAQRVRMATTIPVLVAAR